MEAITSKLIDFFCRTNLLKTIYSLNQHICVTTCMSITWHSESHEKVAFNFKNRLIKQIFLNHISLAQSQGTGRIFNV